MCLVIFLLEIDHAIDEHVIINAANGTCKANEGHARISKTIGTTRYDGKAEKFSISVFTKHLI